MFAKHAPISNPKNYGIAQECANFNEAQKNLIEKTYILFIHKYNKHNPGLGHTAQYFITRNTCVSSYICIRLIEIYMILPYTLGYPRIDFFLLKSISLSHV